MHIEMHRTAAFRTCGTVIQLVPLVAGDELPSAGDAFDPLIAVLRPAVPVERFGTAYRTSDFQRFGHGDKNPFLNGQNILSCCYESITEMLQLC
jgi:hypothetical protein